MRNKKSKWIMQLEKMVKKEEEEIEWLKLQQQENGKLHSLYMYTYDMQELAEWEKAEKLHVRHIVASVQH